MLLINITKGMNVEITKGHEKANMGEGRYGGISVAREVVHREMIERDAIE